MNVAIIKHIGECASNKEYLFRVPSDAKIKKDTLVKVKTRYGESYGVLTRDSFETDGEALKYIRQSMGVGESRELKTITAVYSEIPVCEDTPTMDDMRRGLIAMRDSENNYTVRYSSFPIKFRAKRKDNSEIIESPCVYSTEDGRVYLGARDVNAFVDAGEKTGNIYNMESAESEPIFIEIYPNTLDWTVEK